jgi:hypothetical protein
LCPAGQAWKPVLLGAFALAILLAFVCHPGFSAAPQAGMSAPAPGKAALDSAPVAGAFGTHCDGHPDGLPASGIKPARTTLRLPDGRERQSLPAVAEYSPLYRRPPPALS